MVTRQLAARDIHSEKILTTFREVPRHLFVPEHDRYRAYSDQALPIGEGQTISQPYVVAFMTQVLEPDTSMRVLEIGTGSGYQAAILSPLCKSVYSIEIIPSLGNRALNSLEQLGYKNIHVRIGDGYAGWPEAAPFDAIIVTCSPTHIPPDLIDQLAEGGRMIIPIGTADYQELVLLTKIDGDVIQTGVLPVLFVPMVDTTGVKY